jgi:hypothetical protein
MPLASTEEHPLASLFKRTKKPDAPWWIAFHEPLTGEPIRKSLGTPNERLAEDMRVCVEARTKLQRLQHIALPAEILDLLGGGSINGSAAATGSGRTPIEAVLKSYFQHMAPINDSHHFADKVSKFRQFFGSAIVDPLNPKKTKIVRKKPLPVVPRSSRKSFWSNSLPASRCSSWSRKKPPLISARFCVGSFRRTPLPA